MTHDEAFQLIVRAVEKAVGDDAPPSITRDMDLVETGVLDSLDGMVFLLEIEEASGVKFPQEGDLVGQGFFKVPHLIEILAAR